MQHPYESWEHCPHCSKLTNCRIFATEKRKIFYDIDLELNMWIKFVECQGCQEFFLLYSKENPYGQTGYDGELECTTSTVPISRNEDELCKIGHFKISLDDNVNEFANLLYKQIMESIVYKNFIVAAAGMRTLIDTFCIAKTDKDIGITKNIDVLVSKRFITKKQSNVYKKISEIGHGAVHRYHIPKKQSLINGIRAIEDLYNILFSFPEYEKIVSKESVPPDTRKSKKA